MARATYPPGRRAAARNAVAACAAALGLVSATAAAAPAPAPVTKRELRVCADPNNLPFSNERLEGFENRIAALLARELDAELRTVWWAQRRGFLRATLRAGLCDVVIGIPTSHELVLATRPYYRSTYVFLARPDGPARGIASLDDPRLRTLRIGVHLIGDDYANPPPVHALARRHIVDNVVGYTIYGDYRQPDPPARLVQAVAAGDVDVAIVWGPLGGYFGRRAGLAVTPVRPEIDLPFLPMVFDIAAGVRRGDDALRDELDAVLERRRDEIDAILRSYGVPLVGWSAWRAADSGAATDARAGAGAQ